MPQQIVAFQGRPGAYSDLACRAHLPAWATLPCTTFEDVFAAVHEGRATLAMLPIENSTMGRVADLHHLLPEGGLAIIGEHYQPVEHHLLVRPGVKLADVQEAHSHVQALGQCRGFLRQHGIRAVAQSDTAGSAAALQESGARQVAAIASSLAGEIYGLQSLAGNIADQQGNTTRFLVMGKDPSVPEASSGKVITSLIFRVRSVPAALYKALGGFATNGVNLTKLESYMVGNRFTATQFYADIEGHPDEPRVTLALDELRFFASELRLLGTYPAHPFRDKA